MGDEILRYETRGTVVRISQRHYVEITAFSGPSDRTFRNRLPPGQCWSAAFFAVRLVHYAGMYADVWDLFEWNDKWDRLAEVMRWYTSRLQRPPSTSLSRMSRYIHEGGFF